jgi:hypothetical protein
MALGRFVIGTTVTVPAGTFTADAASGLRFGTGSYLGGGTGATLQWADGSAATFLVGTVIYADSSTPGSTPTAPQQLYTALTAAGANLRAFVDGQDDVGHAAISN